MFVFFCFSSRRRHTRCALVTGVQTCALPILRRYPQAPARLAVWQEGIWPPGACIAYARQNRALRAAALSVFADARAASSAHAYQRSVPDADGQPACSRVDEFLAERDAGAV